MKSPMPIKAKEKVSKKDNPIIKVLILEEILWTISEAVSYTHLTLPKKA